MNSFKLITRGGLLVFGLVVITACRSKFERSGIVVDAQTNLPVEGVMIDIYLKDLKQDSLKSAVITDKQGYFKIRESLNADELFLLSKEGYIDHVSSLSVQTDTLRLERDQK